MAVFFSMTDNEELTDNAPNYNYYLSLIVNNKKEYCARVAFIGEIEGRVIRFKGKDGDLHEIKTESQKCTFYHEVDVVLEDSCKVDPFFLSQYEKVTAPKTNTWDKNKGTTGGRGYNRSLQKSFDFNGKYSQSDTYDFEAVMFLKYVLMEKPSDRIGSLKDILTNMNCSTEKSRNFCKKYIAERFDKSEEIFEEFQKDPNSDPSTTLFELWGRMEDLLLGDLYYKIPVTDLIIEELAAWTWT